MSGEAIVAKIDKIEEIPGANTIQVAFVLGEQVIVSKDKKVGDIGVLFPAETQLSHKYCEANNLYRHSDLNNDKTAKGFFEDNRKVRCMKFMKVRSEAYFADLDSLGWFGFAKIDLKLGDKFSEYKGVEICCKFVSEHTRRAMDNRIKPKKACETPLFKQHVDTDQFKYNVDRIPVGSLLSFHAKLHGTSARYSHTLVKRSPRSTWEKIAKRLFGTFPGEENWEYLAGTRRVVLYPGDREKEGYNGPETYRFEWLDKLKPYLTKGMTVYGEIVGYANGKPIMAMHDTKVLNDKKYTEKYGERMVYKYGCPEGTNRFIIYRITYTTQDGDTLDFTVPQIEKWCEDRGFECSRRVHYDIKYVGDKAALCESVNGLTEREWWGQEVPVLTEDWYDASHIAEGIVIRVDHGGTTPMFLKNKSFVFKVLEGIATLDTVDTEDAS